MNRFAYVLGVMLSGARVSRRSNPMNIGSKLPINNAIRATKAQKPSVYAPEQGIICPLPRFLTGGGVGGVSPPRSPKRLRQRNFLKI